MRTCAGRRATRARDRAPSRLHAHGVRVVDEHVVCRRRVVVGVAHVEAADDAADAVSSVADCASVPSFPTSTRSSPFSSTPPSSGRQSPASIPSTARTPVQPSAGAATRDARRRRGRVRNTTSQRSSSLALAATSDRGSQLDEVDRRRVLHGVELEDQPRPRLDREAVQPLAEELAAVQAPLHELGNVAPEHLRAVQLRHVARQLLRGEARAVGALERDVVPLRRDGEVELDDVVTRERRRVGDDGRPAGRRRPGRLQRFGGEIPAQLLRLGEAHEDLRGDLVGGAAADRVVRRVLDHPTPRELRGTPRATRRRAAPRAAPHSARASARRGLRPP